jgi:hypothetical protein
MALIVSVSRNRDAKYIARRQPAALLL